jgi:hypothetical protein
MKKIYGIKNTLVKVIPELNPFHLPQPYLGNPENCSVITLNLNPVPTSDLRKYSKGILVDKLREKKNYFEFAKYFPQMQLEGYPSKFWNKQFNWIKNIDNDTLENKLPFAIEICPWHSKKWKSLKKISPNLNKHIKENVFDLIEEVIQFANLKTILSVGKTYYDLFNISEFGFEKILEVTPDNHSMLNNIKWPINKKGELSKRFFSIWKYKETNILYFNTYSFGSNTPPSRNWNEIQNYILKTIQ